MAVVYSVPNFITDRNLVLRASDRNDNAARAKSAGGVFVLWVRVGREALSR